MPAPDRRPISCWRANSFVAGAPQQSRQNSRHPMSQPPKPRGLGRGLSALLGDDEVAATVAPAPTPIQTSAPPPLPDYPSTEVANTYMPNRPPLTLPIGQLKPGKMQP